MMYICDQIQWLGKRGVEAVLSLKDAPLAGMLIRTEIDDIATKLDRVRKDYLSCSHLIV